MRKMKETIAAVMAISMVMAAGCAKPSESAAGETDNSVQASEVSESEPEESEPEIKIKVDTKPVDISKNFKLELSSDGTVGYGYMKIPGTDYVDNLPTLLLRMDTGDVEYYDYDPYYVYSLVYDCEIYCDPDADVSEKEMKSSIEGIFGFMNNGYSIDQIVVSMWDYFGYEP